MAFDYKKEYKEFYLPKSTPGFVNVPPMRFVAVRGAGDPNEEGGAYQQAISILYGVAFTIKMSHKGARAIEGYFEYVVPPLEGFWWMPGVAGIDYARKADFQWISAIRLPDFVQRSDFDWAVKEATRKKKQDFSTAEFWEYAEGACVQCMHLGAYDDEPATVALMERFAADNGYRIDITPERYHHEIYLSDARKCAPENRKTVLRHPIAKA